MTPFIRYLASLMLHIAWHGAGRSGAIPPLRLPRKALLGLPAVGSWQVILAFWIVRKIWEWQGEAIKTRLAAGSHEIVTRTGCYLSAADERRSRLQTDRSRPVTGGSAPSGGERTAALLFAARNLARSGRDALPMPAALRTRWRAQSEPA